MTRKSTDLAKLQADLGYTFHDPKLLEAVVNTPYISHKNLRKRSTRTAEQVEFERQEFFGDAQLNVVFHSILLTDFPTLAPQEHTHILNALAHPDTLRMVGTSLRLLDYMDIPDGAGRMKDFEEDATEVLMGAVFKDAQKNRKDPAKALEGVVRHVMAPHLESLRNDYNPKEGASGLMADDADRLEANQNIYLLKQWRNSWVKDAGHSLAQADHRNPTQMNVIKSVDRDHPEKLMWRARILVPEVAKEQDAVDQKKAGVEAKMIGAEAKQKKKLEKNYFMVSSPSLPKAMAEVSRQALNYVKETYKWEPDPATLMTAQQLRDRYPKFGTEIEQ